MEEQLRTTPLRESGAILCTLCGVGLRQLVWVSCGVVVAGCVYGGFERGGDPVDFVTGGTSGTAGSIVHARGSVGAAGREAAEKGTAGIAGHITTEMVHAGSLGAAGERPGSEALGSGLVSAVGTVLKTNSAGSAGFGAASAGVLSMGAAELTLQGFRATEAR